MRLYLAGPMSGLPEYNYPAFNDAAARLREAGFFVANPAEIEPPNPNPTWADWMRAAITLMLTCDAIALLDGWQMSRGAVIERDLANRLGMKTKGVEAWLSTTKTTM